MSAELNDIVRRSQLDFRQRSNTALVLHLHYTDLLEEILPYLHNAAGTDLFVTLPISSSADVAARLISEFPNARLDCLENRGRDVYPFLEQLRLINALGYEYCCKVHSKKSMHRTDGRQLRSGAFASLLGSPEIISKHVALFEADTSVGLIAPPGSVLDLSVPSRVEFNRRWLSILSPRSQFADVANDPNSKFVAGTMFWFRLKALSLLSTLNLTKEDFEEEAGQSDGTLAHAVERLIGAVAAKSHYRIVEAQLLTEVAAAREEYPDEPPPHHQVRSSVVVASDNIGTASPDGMTLSR